MSMFATPRTPTSGYTDELGKDDLVGALAIFKVVDYDPETTTKYGVTATTTCEVTVVDGPHAGTVEPRFFAAGNLARQIGAGLDPGQMAPGRIVTGSSANGRSWYGITWATDPADLQKAEAALTPKPTLGAQVRQSVANIKQTARQTDYDANAPF